MGGDFFDYIDLPSGQFGFILGDVAGKGSPAALLAAAVLGMFSAEATYHTSASAVRVLRSCLEKDPKRRLQAIGDWRLVLEDAQPVSVTQGKLRWVIATATGAILVAVLLAPNPKPLRRCGSRRRRKGPRR